MIYKYSIDAAAQNLAINGDMCRLEIAASVLAQGGFSGMVVKLEKLFAQPRVARRCGPCGASERLELQSPDSQLRSD